MVSCVQGMMWSRRFDLPAQVVLIMQMLTMQMFW